MSDDLKRRVEQERTDLKAKAKRMQEFERSRDGGRTSRLARGVKQEKEALRQEDKAKRVFTQD